MDGRSIARWEQTQAELEMRRWLIAHNLWAPEAERMALVPTPVEEAEVRPAAVLGTLLVTWPTVRQRLEMLLAARMHDKPRFYPYHAEATIIAFEIALRQIAELAVQFDGPPLDGPPQTE